MKRYAYYLSCINESMTKELDRSISLWEKDLGIELVHLHESTCCGGSNLDYVSPKHFALVNARTLRMLKNGARPRCFLQHMPNDHTHCQKEARRFSGTAAEVNEILKAEGLEYRGTSEVRHLLWVLIEDVGLRQSSQK